MPGKINGARLVALTALALLAFAGNSLLCRVALSDTAIDPASFTTLRLLSGALTLWAIVALGRGTIGGQGSWPSALALFVYAAAFSFAYTSLTAATGALLLFGAVQLSMTGIGIARGERLQGRQVLGMLLALGGLVGLLLPGLSAPPPLASALMIAAGIAWGVYSLRGRGAIHPTRVTAGNFLRTVPFAALLSVITLHDMTLDTAGVAYALASGALTSGVGYAIWYAVLPSLRAASAATLQLSVPVITAFGGVVLLGEAMTVRIVLASIAIIGGTAIVLHAGRST